MDPTSLPTDNLYKFLTLACLLGMGALWYSTQKKLNDHAKERLLNQLERGKLEVILARIKQDRSLSADRAHHDQVDAREREAEVRDKELRRTAVNLDDEKKFLEAKRYRAFVGLCILGVVVVVGFYVWYTKVQWFQDQVTRDAWREQKAKADLAEIELSEARRKKPASSAPAHREP